jgi:hypothetical protein
MASAAAFPSVDPGEVIPLDPNEIELGERLRPIDASWATAIGQSMKRDGQIHAVDVRHAGGRWQLAGAGGHRVTGARLANIPVECRVVLFDEDVSRRREAAENLFRRANDPLERAEAIAELVRIHRERAGIATAKHRSISVPKRLREEAEETLETISNVYGWSDEIGAELGLTGRTIRNDLFLYRGLQPSVVHHLREARHPVLKNAAQLRALAKLSPVEQARATAKLLAGAKSVNEAIRMVRGSNSVAQTAEDKRLATFIGTFSRMSLSEKRGALAQLAGMLPAPFKLVEERP